MDFNKRLSKFSKIAFKKAILLYLESLCHVVASVEPFTVWLYIYLFFDSGVTPNV